MKYLYLLCLSLFFVLSAPAGTRMENFDALQVYETLKYNGVNYPRRESLYAVIAGASQESLFIVWNSVSGSYITARVGLTDVMWSSSSFYPVVSGFMSTNLSFIGYSYPPSVALPSGLLDGLDGITSITNVVDVGSGLSLEVITGGNPVHFLGLGFSVSIIFFVLSLGFGGGWRGFKSGAGMSD